MSELRTESFPDRRLSGIRKGVVVLCAPAASGGSAFVDRLRAEFQKQMIDTVICRLDNSGAQMRRGPIDRPAIHILFEIEQVQSRYALPVGIFAFGDAVHAALEAAALARIPPRAIVCTDGARLPVPASIVTLECSMMFIARAGDGAGIRFCQAAMHKVRAEAELRILPAAESHFGELRQMALTIRDSLEWFSAHLVYKYS